MGFPSCELGDLLSEAGPSYARPASLGQQLGFGTVGFSFIRGDDGSVWSGLDRRSVVKVVPAAETHLVNYS